MGIRSGFSDSTLVSSQRYAKHFFERVSYAQKQLQSGHRILSAKDDASGDSIATRLLSRIIALEEGIRSLQETNAALAIAQEAVEKIEMHNSQIERLQVRRNTGFKSADQIALVDFEIQKNQDAIQALITETSFNGQNLLDGSIDGKVINYGTGTITLRMNEVRNAAALAAAQGEDAAVAAAEVQVNNALDAQLQFAINGRVGAMQAAVTALPFNNVQVGGHNVTLNGGGAAAIQAAANAVIGAQGAVTITQQIRAGAVNWGEVSGRLTTLFENSVACEAAVHNAISGAVVNGGNLMTTAQFEAQRAIVPLNQQVIDYYEAFASTIGTLTAGVIADLQNGATAVLIKINARQAIENAYAMLPGGFAPHGNFVAPAVPAGPLPRTPEQRIYAMCKEKYDAIGVIANANTLIAAYNAGRNGGAIIANEAMHAVPVEREFKNSIAMLQKQIDLIQTAVQGNLDKLREARSIIKDVDALEAQVSAITSQTASKLSASAFLHAIKSQSGLNQSKQRAINLMMNRGQHRSRS